MHNVKGSLFLMDTFSKSCALSLYWIYLMLIYFSVFFHKSLDSWLTITVLELHEYVVVVLMMVVVVVAMIMIDSWKCWWFTAPDMDFRISPLDFPRISPLDFQRISAPKSDSWQLQVWIFLQQVDQPWFSTREKIRDLKRYLIKDQEISNDKFKAHISQICFYLMRPSLSVSLGCPTQKVKKEPSELTRRVHTPIGYHPTWKFG